VVDLHFQSTRTAPDVLDEVLPAALGAHAEVWVVTGTGHHVDRHGHQQHAPGGVLHGLVAEYLAARGVPFRPGRDRAGHSGAFLVHHR
jgi:hypothetical protein